MEKNDTIDSIVDSITRCNNDNVEYCRHPGLRGKTKKQMRSCLRKLGQNQLMAIFITHIECKIENQRRKYGNQ